MKYIVFNGDADGICAAVQELLVFPVEAKLISGVKRDIQLLRHAVDVKSAEIQVYDISLLKNRSELDQCLLNGCSVTWFDHHQAGELPKSDLLKVTIDMAPEVCTAILVDRALGGKQRDWAIAGAYGDNLQVSAEKLGEGYSQEKLKILKDLGECLNYNGYGESLEDLAADPVDVLKEILSVKDAFEFHQSSELFAKIKEQKSEDEQVLKTTEVLYESSAGSCVLLPDHPASIRMSGIFSNDLVYANPDKAHAIFTKLSDGQYRISIRAPLTKPEKADELASMFPGGGGRAKAAGVNELPAEKLKNFFEAFDKVFV